METTNTNMTVRAAFRMEFDFTSRVKDMRAQGACLSEDDLRATVVEDVLDEVSARGDKEHVTVILGDEEDIGTTGLLAALRLYADKNSWLHTTAGVPILSDEGDTARHALEAYARATGPDADMDGEHVDDFVQRSAVWTHPAAELGNVSYARWVLMHFRLPATMRMEFRRFYADHLLYCTYEGKRHRCVTASRMGDVGLTEDLDSDKYTKRVAVAKCTWWSDKP